MKALEATDVSHSYGDVQALSDVSVEIARGVTALVGVNGAGKSTLLMALAGGLRPDKGCVRIEGLDLYGRSHRKRGLTNVAFVPQLPQFPKNLRAVEAVSYLAWMRGCPAVEAPNRARDALGQVGLGAQTNKKLGTLSGGMLRRVALAQALASRAEVLLLDEPSTGLDPRRRREMVDLLKDLPGTVLISSHVMEDVADLAERVIVLDEGRIKFNGDVTDLGRLAPTDVADHRRLEAGFLSLTSGSAP
ncbi:hypothetical protein BJH93_05615 [Kocuria polaris]|nr:hypothetical protein [Kocuria polaris]